MNNLRVLHVASFTGNVGDNANHTGFKQSFEKHIGCDISYTNFEIREVFWKIRSFDEKFVELANSHDLVVIGGGNYFELWVDDSATGTSIDISLELLDEIRVPIVFNALGVDPAQGATFDSITKFRKFLDYAIKSPTIMLSCRNDGSIKALKELIGLKYADAFYHVPDSGLFTTVGDFLHPELSQSKKNIAIQLAGDMISTRFPVDTIDDIGYEGFLASMAKYVAGLSDAGIHVVLVPHIFRDLDIIHALLNVLPDGVRRQNVSVAPYLVGQVGQDYLFDLYRKTDLVLGMRFHANVCSIGLGRKCIGLVNYRQIDEFYDEMGLNEFKVAVNKKGFEVQLEVLTELMLKGNARWPEDVAVMWRKRLDVFHSDIKSMLVELGVV